MSRVFVAVALIALLLGVSALLVPAAAGAAEGQMTWAVHTSIVPTWFDPAESIQGTPFDFAFLHGVGPRVEEPGLGLLSGYGFSGLYEDVTLKGR